MEVLLSRSFFEEELPRLTEAFAADTGAQKVATDLLLRTGTFIRLEGTLACSDTYLTFDRKSGSDISRMVLPYGAIFGVTFTPENNKTVGFHR